MDARETANKNIAEQTDGAARMHRYLASLRGKTVAVLGLGVSNVPLVELLCRAGVRVIGCDRREELGESGETLRALGATLHLGAGYLDDLDAAEVIFRTPGMRPDLAPLAAARARGAAVTSEMETFFALCPCPILGVTGSDGKTTTTTILAEMLRAAGRRVWLGGNIGYPLLADVPQIDARDIAVVELSSFQLMDMTHSPQLAVLTNLAPNHLDVHRDMDEYIYAKENILRHQSPRDTAVYNRDNAITARLAENAHGETRGFGWADDGRDGAFVRDGAIWLRRGEACRAVLPLADIRLPGRHNIENYMAACAALDGTVEDATMQCVAREFGGVEHRIEFVREVRGAKYYNDSIATSPTRAIAGLHAFEQKVILLAGGYDKHIPFTELGGEVCRHVKTLILCGDTAEKIESAVLNAPEEEKPRILHAETLAQSVSLAVQEAQEGDIVLLSPACAAFDRYKNFMERGRNFKALVAALTE